MLFANDPIAHGSLKESLKAALRKRGLTDLAVKLLGQQERLRARLHGGRDRRLTKAYLDTNPVAKLHVACGSNLVDGWLNSDLFSAERVVSIDATKRFAFRDAVFDYVFNEHMIEHITFEQGLDFLGECFRVLKPGGRLRISTPDLAFVVGLYTSSKSPLQKAYIQWAADLMRLPGGSCADTFVVNSFVRDWGHTFIYDDNVLRQALEHVGFRSIVNQPIRESADPVLCHLENAARMPDGFLALESFVLEAVKPGPSSNRA